MSEPLTREQIESVIQHLRDTRSPGLSNVYETKILEHDAALRTRLEQMETPDGWLHGSVRHGSTVMLGASRHCAGCGRCHGIGAVVVARPIPVPTRTPCWPFPVEDCPLCHLAQRLEQVEQQLATEQAEIDHYQRDMLKDDKLVKAQATIMLLRAAIANEPELPGEMPDEMFAAIKNNKAAYTELRLRIAVRKTKEHIQRALSETEGA